jgi:hypothetical protein
MSQVLQCLNHWLEQDDIRPISGRYRDDTPERERETETETETQVEAEADNARVRDGSFEVFWDAYPHKVGKKAALRAFAVAKRSGVGLPQMLTALACYKSDKPPDRQWCNPATWLNQGRWEDQPAEIKNGSTRQKSELIDAADTLIERIQGFGTPGAFEIGGAADAVAIRMLPKG